MNDRPSVIMKKVSEIHPYEKNPRKNDGAVDFVANSIKQFGFKVPMVITSDGEIVTGHTRFKAAKKLGMKEVPVIIADDLSEEQIKAFRLADNKTSEMAFWDFPMLSEALQEIEGMADIGFEMTDFGFTDFEIDGILNSDMETETEDDDLAAEYVDEEQTNGRIILVYKDEAQRDWIAKKLNIEIGGWKMIYSVDELTENE